MIINYQKCPICENEFKKKYTIKLHCTNTCFTVQLLVTEIEIKIFNETFTIPVKEYYASQEYQEMVQRRLDIEVMYWKENDRYLAEILKGEN